MDNLFNYFTRVNFNESDLGNILETICNDYKFTNIKEYKVIETGYEDFNVYLETSDKKLVVKFFSNERSIDNINHYIKIVEYLANQTFLKTPKVYKNDDSILGNIIINNKSINYFVMEYIEGKTVYELEKDISLKTILKIVFDILKYNCVNTGLIEYLQTDDAKKHKQYDMWSYENFLIEWEKKNKYLNDSDRELIKPIVDYYESMIKRYENYSEKFKNMPVMPPYMSAHNDFISTNIIIDKNNEPCYIDFSVSSIALNFVDIAIFGCDSVLCKNIDSKEYAKYLKIISYILYRTHIMEYNLYPTSVAVQHAIHILIANYYKVVEKVNSEENDYFLNLGRVGIKYLKQENLLNKPVFNWINKDGWYERAELSEYSEYSNVKKIIKDLDLDEFIETNIKEYSELYNKYNNTNYANVKLDDMYKNGYDWLYSCIENTNEEDNVMAISFCNDNEWNGNKEEIEWTNLNIDALKRGVKMQRIFVYPDNKKELVLNNKYISKFLDYKKDNLELLFISENKVKTVLNDRIKEIIPGVLTFNNDIAFIDVIDDVDNRGYTIFDKDKINTYYEIYNILKEYCD